ncbi:MAG: hypothetical protein ACI37J_09460 [Candidatus Bruticola sp.]
MRQVLSIRSKNGLYKLLFITIAVLFVMSMIPLFGSPALGEEKSPTFETLSKGDIGGEELLQIANDSQNMIAWRKFAEEKLKQDKDSPVGHAVLGVVFHCAEGDLPRARHNLELAKKTLLRRLRGFNNGTDGSLFLGVQIQLCQVLGEMDDYKAKIKVVDELASLPGFSNFAVDKAWPLMKLDREEEARKVISDAFNSGNISAREIAWNSLGALESECGNYQASYNAFRNLVNETKERGKTPDPTVLRNCGETALALGRFDEAEQFFNEASRVPFSDQAYTNPFNDLTNLYIAEAKFTDAASCLKKTYERARAMRPFLYQQFMADNLQTTGALLMELGLIPEACERLKRLVNRPDRQGGTSLDIDQAEAGNLLTWYASLKAMRECKREELSWTPFWKSFKVRGQIIAISYELWRSSSRVRALITENKRVASSFRPYNAQSISADECYKPLLIKILGPGLCATAIDEIFREAPDNLPVEEPYLLLHRAEIAYQFGNYEASLKNYKKALKTLPQAAQLVRSLAAARVAQLSYGQGDFQTAANYYARLITSTPTSIRHMEISVPITCQGDGSSVSKQLISMLGSSPRFKVTHTGLTMRIHMQGGRVAAELYGLDGGVLSSSSVKLEDSTKKTAEKLAAEIHNQTFATKISFSSLGLDSLDGAATSGSTARQQINDMFEKEKEMIDG